MLLQKLKVLSQKKQALDAELQEAKGEIERLKRGTSNSVTFPKITSASKQRLTEEQEVIVFKVIEVCTTLGSPIVEDREWGALTCIGSEWPSKGSEGTHPVKCSPKKQDRRPDIQGQVIRLLKNAYI